MEGNPGGAAPADRPEPSRYRWRAADRLRASDADRDKAISQLWHRYDQGHLTYDTFAHRVEGAVKARSRSEIAALLADLPSPHRLGSALLSCWQRGAAAVAGAIPQVLQGRSTPMLMFPSGDQRRFTIGRDMGCDMVLPDPSVSRWHAGLKREEGGWMLDDLGSTNGTRLNGWRVRAWVPVRDGDLVSFGAATYVFGRPGTGRGLSRTGGLTSR